MARTGRRGKPTPWGAAARGGEGADDPTAAPSGPRARDRVLWIVSLAIFAAWFLFLLRLAIRN